ncbi:MAG TPA: hypothetical protein VFF19_18330 [Reyranella sp.]|nr:hypothetical protein [Reyranella sp.]
MALDRSQIALPSLPEELVPVPSLGGDVLVRGMLLNESLEHDTRVRLASAALPGESEDEARARAGSAVIGMTLHVCVVDEAGNRLFSAAEWNRIGVTDEHRADIYKLFNVARRLSGREKADVSKN